MAAITRQTKSRFTRWFKKLRVRNQPPYKWYECGHLG